MRKVKRTNELIEKAISVFKVRKQIRAGEGLSRAELRTLKQAGIVDFKSFKEKGGIFNIWFVNESGISEMIGKIES